MKSLFADSFYWFAILNPRDLAHQRALSYSAHAVSLITTTWVITELADGLCKVPSRKRFLQLLELIHNDPYHTVIPSDSAIYDRGLALYASRPDKDWSLTDCISFVVMTERGITEALTADKHFEQAGFRAVLA